MSLGFRTVPCSHVIGMLIRKEALGALEDDYVRFATQCVELDNTAAAAAAAAKVASMT